MKFETHRTPHIRCSDEASPDTRPLPRGRPSVTSRFLLGVQRVCLSEPTRVAPVSYSWWHTTRNDTCVHSLPWRLLPRQLVPSRVHTARSQRTNTPPACAADPALAGLSACYQILGREKTALRVNFRKVSCGGRKLTNTKEVEDVITHI